MRLALRPQRTPRALKPQPGGGGVLMASNYIIAAFAVVTGLTTWLFHRWQKKRRRPRPIAISADATKFDTESGGLGLRVEVQVANPGDVPLVIFGKPEASSPEVREYQVDQCFLSRSSAEKGTYANVIPPIDFDKYITVLVLPRIHEEKVRNPKSGFHWYPEALKLKVSHVSGDRQLTTSWRLGFDSKEKGHAYYKVLNRKEWCRLRASRFRWLTWLYPQISRNRGREEEA